MTLLALVALVASVLVWAAPSSQAQGNQAPFADAGPDQTVNPSTPGTAVTASLDGTGSIDVDDDGTDPFAGCGGCELEWEVETGPYDWIEITTPDTPDGTATFDVPSEAFVDKVSDSDPQKYEIVVRLTVTDDKGATDSDTVSININQRPVANIQVYAGLRDRDIADADVGVRGHFPIDAVIDGPGENGNRDNEWDIMEGAWLQLDGSASTDENPGTGKPAVYQWTRVRPTVDVNLAGYAPNQDTASATNQRLTVSVNNNPNGTASNAAVINFGDVDGDDTPNEPANPDASPPQIAETVTHYTLPQVAPNRPETVFYRLTVCDSVLSESITKISEFTGADITEPNDTDCTGRTGSALVRIVVHDTSSDPSVRVVAGLTAASTARGDAKPQSTVGQITGVENQFLVAAGSTVELKALVTDRDQPDGAHTFRWSGATPGSEQYKATVRVPSDADDGDTIDVSVTVTDRTRISETTDIQLLVGENTAPTAGGVDANKGSIDNPLDGDPVLYVHSITDGFQNPKDGSTVTLRGVANDADGDALITSWSLRDAPAPLVEATAFDGGTMELGCNANRATGDTDTDDTIADANKNLLETIDTWITASAAEDANKLAVDGAALPLIGCVLANTSEAADPLFELSGAFTDTVSFEVPNLENGEDAGALLFFTVIDTSTGVGDAQIIYIHIRAEDDAPDAKAGDDQQVDPEAFVRLNGSASSDPDVGDDIDYKWEYVGATMDPAPDDRSPLSADEVDELDGWILHKNDDGTWDYIVDSDGTRAKKADGTFVVDGDDFDYSANLKSRDTAYPWFDAPDLTGFNNINLTFKLTVTDEMDKPNTEGTEGRDVNGDGDATDKDVDNVNEVTLGFDVNGDDNLDTDVDNVNETLLDDGVPEYDSDMVTIKVVNRFFSGNISGPDFCTEMSLGGPQTYPLDSDDDGVADTCSLNTTRRATVARQNALETLATLNPVEFRNEVLAVCAEAGFKQTDYGDDPEKLEDDVCETERVTSPPVEVDAADADVAYSGIITGPDFCANHSLGGARTYAFDSDGDGVADTCSLHTTKREAIARQRALEEFNVDFSAQQQANLNFTARLLELDNLAAGDRTIQQATEYADLLEIYSDSLRERGVIEDDLEELTVGDVTLLTVYKDGLEDRKSRADRYSNALAAECRALGTKDFGDAASAVARDECVPTPRTGQALPPVNL